MSAPFPLFFSQSIFCNPSILQFLARMGERRLRINVTDFLCLRIIYSPLCLRIIYSLRLLQDLLDAIHRHA
jgi:hypothetical protein